MEGIGNLVGTSPTDQIIRVDRGDHYVRIHCKVYSDSS